MEPVTASHLSSFASLNPDGLAMGNVEACLGALLAKTPLKRSILQEKMW